MNPVEPSTDDPRLLAAAKEYITELEAGRRPDRTAFIERFSAIRTELEPYLDALDLFHSAGPPIGSALPAAPPPEEEPLPAEPLGDFRIVRKIGHGGMGTVYEAVQLSLGRRVALKVLPFAAALDNKQLQRFKNEAQAAAQLHHTNIVPVHAVGCERGVHYYAMQLIEGQNLAELIRQLRPPDPSGGVDDLAGAHSTPHSTVDSVAAELTTKRASRSEGYYRTMARIAIQAAEALEHAHQMGVIHRDIKPANLLMDGRGNLWITDFGLAQFHTSAGLTRTGDILGTLRYMSPEQADGRHAAVDARSDVYALGATLYEMLTLRPMFDAEDHHRLLRQILHDEAKPPRAVDRRVPVELETILLKAVSKNPADRYGSAREFADDLRRFVDNRPILARRPTLPARLRKWGRRHPSVPIAAGVLLVLIAVGSSISSVLIWQARDSERQRAEEAEAQFRLAQKAVNEMIAISNEELAGNPATQQARKRLLESALVYYQEFIDRREGNPAAQDELRTTKKQVEGILADLAELQGAQRSPLLHHKAVLDELGLEEDQRKQVKEMLGDGWQKLVRWGKHTPAERERLFAELMRTEDDRVQKILRPEQYRRLRQIALQQQGLAAFRDPSVIAALKLTAQQRDKLRVIEADTFFGGPPGPPPGPPPDRMGGPPRDGHKGFGDKMRVARQRALDVLTPEQRQTWSELTGAAFTVPMMFGGKFGPPPKR
jgi:serine/threonine protein kinase